MENLGDYMRVLVTGGTGLLGWWVVKVFSEKGFNVIATYHSRKLAGLGDVNWVRLDLKDAQNIVDVVKSARPDIIIHCAAYTDVDGSEVNRAEAYVMNYLGTKTLASVSREVEYFIHVSTDYVFDGEKGFYRESDVPNPVNYYGLTKLLGEAAVENALPDKSCIVRVSGLYGYSPTGKRNFGRVALEKLLRSEEVKAFHDQYLSPTYVAYLAESLVRLVEKRITGTLHVAGDRQSRYEFATTLARILGVDASLVKPVSMSEVKLVARRPRDSSLDVSRAKHLGLSLPPTTECIKHFVEVYKRVWR